MRKSRLKSDLYFSLCVAPISPGRAYSPDLTDASKLPAIEEMILPSHHNDDVESSPFQELEDDVIDSDDELIPIRTKSLGIKILVKGCLCYSSKVK